jgi:uncharacterized membrane protein YdjX (TVP38/TMEM64 family)
MRPIHLQMIGMVIACLPIIVSGFHSHNLGSLRYKDSISTNAADMYYRTLATPLLASTVFPRIGNSPAGYGFTADGEECKNCIKQGRFCWQHRWQERNISSSEKEKSNAEEASTMLGLRENIIALALIFVSMVGLKRHLLLRSFLSTCYRTFHPAHLKDMAYVTLGQLTIVTGVKIRMTLDSLTCLYIKRPWGVTLGSPLILSLILGRYLYLRSLETTELLLSVEDSVRQIRYVCESSSAPYRAIAKSHLATVPSYANAVKRLAIKKPSSYNPWSQLMAKTYDNGDDSSDASSLSETKKKKLRLVSNALPVLFIIAIGAAKRDVIFATLQAWKANYNPAKMVPLLDRLNDAGLKGQITYTFCLLLWTMTVGMTTPVETAAGIAFGVQKGIICNAIGKIGGAVLSFLIGRHFLYKYVHRQLEDNELLGLVEESIQEHPFAVSLMMRFSPLPEAAKNFGLSTLKVPARWFAVAVLLHGLTFTCLWTCLGAETASVMRGGVPSKTLKVLMTGVSWFSASILSPFFCLPFLMVVGLILLLFLFQVLYHLPYLDSGSTVYEKRNGVDKN